MSPALASSATDQHSREAEDSVLVAVDPQERIDSLLAHLGTRAGGLSSREAQRRLVQFGVNEISRPAGRGWWRELIRQLAHPLALLLWVAAALAAASGSRTLAIAIVAVIMLNAVLAYAQELQAERATEALKELLPVRARVRRDGTELDVPAEELVPGDVVLLAEGDRLSADARLTQGSVEANMAPLTGELQPVVRSSTALQRATSMLEAEDLVFAGTLCRGIGGGGRVRDRDAHAAGPDRCAVAAREAGDQPVAASGQPRRVADRGDRGPGRRDVLRRRHDARRPVAGGRRDVRDRLVGGQRARGACRRSPCRWRAGSGVWRVGAHW